MNFLSKLKWSILLFTLPVVPLFPALSRANPAATQPSLVIESPRYDAGTHWEGDTVSHTFEVKNSGSEVLKILSVKPG